LFAQNDESTDRLLFFVSNYELCQRVPGMYIFLNNPPFDLNVQQQCETNNGRLSKLRTSMVKLMELTEKYICKSSHPDSSIKALQNLNKQTFETKASTAVADQTAGYYTILARKK
jgi:hypothetical protein